MTPARGHLPALSCPEVLVDRVAAYRVGVEASTGKGIEAGQDNRLPKKIATLTRRDSLAFAPAGAKAGVAAGSAVDGPVGSCRTWIEPVYKDVVQSSAGRSQQKHGVAMSFMQIAATVWKGVAETLRDILVTVAGEAVKGEIRG